MPQINTDKRNAKTQSPHQGYPALEAHREKVLIVVKTAPNPSDKYRETVCTAGITEQGKWIRLYPLPYRYMDFYKRFSKYQWIDVNIQKRPREKDFRVDSYQPDIASISPIGKPLPADKWTQRKQLVLPTISKSMEDIKDKYTDHNESLGIFKPKKITNFIIKPVEETWSKKHTQVLSQQVLFGEQPKVLEKLPFKFSYEFECTDERCTGHTMQIIDWELYELYRHMKEKNPLDIDLALEKVKQKWFTDMWDPKRDSYLIVGSVYPKPTFVVLGVFWPPK